MAEDVKLSALGRHPKIILLFYFVFVCILYQCTYKVGGTHLQQEAI